MSPASQTEIVATLDPSVPPNRVSPNRKGQADRLLASLARQFPVAASLAWGWVSLDEFASAADTLVLLADRLAARGQGDVLLADADIQRKSLTRRLEMKVATGLSDMVASTATLPECRTRAGEAGPWLMPAGQSRLRRQFLTAVPRCVDHLLEAHRFSLFALGDGRTPLAAELARRCDAVYCFVRLGGTPRVEFQQRCRQLQADGVAVRGCVVLPAAA
jgi:hypothetical protein